MIGIGHACRPHRTALLDLVEHGERGPATAAALEHVAVCQACEQEVTGVALTVAALLRAGAAYRRLPEPPPVAVGVAALPQPRRWGWRLQLGGLVAGAALAAAVVVPQAGMLVASAPAVPPDSVTPAQGPGPAPWQAAELRLAGSSGAGSVTAVVDHAGSPLPRYPDTMFKPVKEVTASDASVRVLKPR